jgi:PadR family transcriptional regulator, regulatory protein PadR
MWRGDVVVSRVEVVVLGLLAEQPLYGYQLLERFQERGMGHWADVGRASVYQALHRLERGGLITGRSQGRDDGPDRRVYRINRTGRDRLRQGVQERLGAGSTAQSEAGVALGLAYVLPGTGPRRAIEARQDEVAELIRTAEAQRGDLSGARGPGAHLARRMLDLQVTYLRAERGWLRALHREAGRLRR